MFYTHIPHNYPNLAVNFANPSKLGNHKAYSTHHLNTNNNQKSDEIFLYLGVRSNIWHLFLLPLLL